MNDHNMQPPPQQQFMGFQQQSMYQQYQQQQQQQYGQFPQYGQFHPQPVFYPPHGMIPQFAFPPPHFPQHYDQHRQHHLPPNQQVLPPPLPHQHHAQEQPPQHHQIPLPPRKKFDPKAAAFIPGKITPSTTTSTAPSTPSTASTTIQEHGTPPSTPEEKPGVEDQMSGFVYSRGDVTLPLVFGEGFDQLRAGYLELKAKERPQPVNFHDSDGEKEVDSAPVRQLGWAAVAQSAAKKYTNVTSTPSVPTKPQDKMTTVVSNALEPLGSVILRYMFDENFSRYSKTLSLPEIVPRGLVNTGNICFMSSIMQMLLFCQPFYEALNIISNKAIHSIGETKIPLFDAVVDFYHNFNVKLDRRHKEREYADSFTPVDFFRAISKNVRFQHLKWGQQEDAEEFFGYLLDGLHEEFTASVKSLSDDDIKQLTETLTDSSRRTVKANLRKFHAGEFNSSESSGKAGILDDDDDDGWQEAGQKRRTAKRTVEVKPSPIRRIFGGQFRSVLTVPQSKESQSITLDPFQQIQLDISDKKTRTLEDAFEQISHVEEIPMKTNEGVEVIAKKQTFVDQWPGVLVVHLKRFSFESNGRVEKLKKTIQYPLQLIVPEKCMSPSSKRLGAVKYKLCGVVYHHGQGSNGGHYTVDVLRAKGKWIRIDDVSIQSLEPEDVLVKGEEDSKTAYILMYQKL